ncbi:30S ribosome-binding factor RbfA [Methylobrevis pamukkalensis]|uniref:Ribosome-binding factor A n=1 Tax=Methylobrevis pamukkalensis TaxID=1439726 RepID=A0A1E3H957_9HYPH|nr:30S ribosome-binding factor RbfA [Methylobrevis pamukkalensis]ODN72326.1 Ribosome-binding factor A [Methylobrevis pamukkalensis]
MARKNSGPASGLPSQRQLRVGELIRHVIAEILARSEIADPELEAMMITVPEVRMSPDLQHATIFVTLTTGGDASDAVKALSRHAKWLRGQVAHKVNLRFAPELRFRYDTRFDETARIDALLRSPEVARDLKRDDDEA